MASPGHIGWKEAMNDEWSLLSGRKEGRARSLGERVLPKNQKRFPNQQVIRSTWQLLEKLDGDGNHEKI